MISIFGTVSAIIIIFQAIVIFSIDLENILYIESEIAFIIKFAVFFVISVPYITLWIAASNHDKLKEVKSELNEIKLSASREYAKTKTLSSAVSNSNLKLSDVNRGRDWTCKKCGETNTNTTLYCKNCGEYK